MKILFLDFDGVIRMPVDYDTPDGCDYCPDRMRRVAWIVRATGAMLVVCSERRILDGYEKIMADLEPCLPRAIFHPDWRTPDHPPARGRQVEAWLDAHPEVWRYAILDDTPEHYDDAPLEIKQRLVVVPGDGITPHMMPHVSALLNIGTG